MSDIFGFDAFRIRLGRFAFDLNLGAPRLTLSTDDSIPIAVLLRIHYSLQSDITKSPRFIVMIMPLTVSIMLYLQTQTQLSRISQQIYSLSLLTDVLEKLAPTIVRTLQATYFRISIVIRPYDSRVRKKINSMSLIVSTHVIEVVLWVQRPQ